MNNLIPSLKNFFEKNLKNLSETKKKIRDKKKCKYVNGGFSLIESLIGVFVFAIIAMSVYQGYAKIMDMVRMSRLKITATALANEQFEIIRNLPYVDVGISGGLPLGKITQNQTLTRDGVSFDVKTTVRNIDDPFDGTIGGNPNDTSPADYKLAEVEISCATCKNFQPVFFTSRVAPKNLETASTNGALFIQVLDATGLPIQGANVYIKNNQTSPTFIINDTTNNDGFLQIVDAPPGVGVYEIIVSKSGYSTEQTYIVGDYLNPNPVKPHTTVVLQQVTQLSFSIDKTSALNVSTVTETCVPVASVDFFLKGLKLIGATPNVFKYEANHTSSGIGKKTISSLEWGNYNILSTDATYDLIGSIPLAPFTLNPNTNQDFKFIVAPKKPRSILVAVKDFSTGLPISNANVTLEKTGYSDTLSTGRGFLRQTDWSEGSGQSDFINMSRYYDSGERIDVVNPAGEIKLKKIFDEYETSENLTSSTFDTGSASNFGQILWQPQDQPPETGSNSVKFQIATNNNKTTWNFLGPDGTVNTFYTLTNMNINPIHNGDRYIRYKVFLETANTAFTPNVADVAMTFTSACTPSGQVIFTSLPENAEDYTVTVSKNGYQTFSDTKVKILSPWQQYEVILSP